MISVLLPTYNSQRTVVMAINSILNQTFRDYELLVLDDGSSDDTVSLVNRISDSRIRVICLEHQGLAGTLNIGLSVARFNIIARMDADDLCVPRRFERQLEVFKNVSSNTILSSWYGIFTGERLQYIVRTPTSSKDIKKGLLLHSYISHPGLMCNKRVLIENDGYVNNVEIDAFQDYETWLSIKEKVEFVVIPEVLMFQRYRKESLSNNLSYKNRIMYAIQEPYYKDLTKSFGIVSHKVENEYRGWREYFYGNPLKARKYWFKMGVSIFHSPRILIACVVTLLPKNVILFINELRIRYRILYLIKYFHSSSRLLRKQFDHVMIGEIETI